MQFPRVSKCLHFARTERILHLRTVGINNRIRRILPALVLYSLLGACLVFVETTFIAAVLVCPVEPIESRPNVRPNQIFIANPMPEFTYDDRKQKWHIRCAEVQSLWSE